MKADCAVIITAAGLSGRMGFPKALLKWNDKMNFLQKIIATYSSFECNEIIVTLNEDCFADFNKLASSSVRFILNTHPDMERMYSIQLGLNAIKNSSYCFVQSIDNPFIEVNILEEIFLNRSQESYVVPSFQGKSGHPVLINKRIINSICNLEINKQKFNEVLRQFSRNEINIEYHQILYNINTLEDYNTLFNLS